MDANRQRFWMLADQNDWPGVEANQQVEYDAECRRLRLRDTPRARPLRGLVDEPAADQLQQTPATARDAFGTYAYWDDKQSAVLAQGALGSEANPVTLFTPEANETVADLALGFDDVLYIATQNPGGIRLLDRRDRWKEIFKIKLAGLVPVRLAADPAGGVWALGRNPRRVARLRGLPLRDGQPGDFSAPTFRPVPENPEPPNLELDVSQPKWEPNEKAVAIACSPEGPVAVLTHRLDAAANPPDQAWLYLRDPDGTWQPARQLAGVGRCHSLTWLSGSRIAVLPAPRRAGNRPVKQRHVPAFDPDNQTAQLQPVGAVYPLIAAEDGPFLQGVTLPPHYPTGPAQSRPVVALSAQHFSAEGEIAGRVLDGGRNGVTWHRLYLEAVIPPQCGIVVGMHATNDPTPDALALFSAGDFFDLPALAGRLIEQTRPIDAWLAGQLSPATTTALSGYQDQGADPAALLTGFAQDFNRIIGGPSIHEVQRFAGVVLRPETQRLLAQNPQGNDLKRLNRFLLEDAYPQALLEWDEHHFGTTPKWSGADRDEFQNQPTAWFAPARGVWLSDRSELPHHAGLLGSDPAPGSAGLFTALVQRPGRFVRTLTGRYLHVQVRLLGPGHTTPQLAALRVYGSRFSYRDQYLPELYREELFGEDAQARGRATPADFLERFLGLYESVLTPLEDRVGMAHVVMDPRSTPDDALEWLGSWMGAVFDPAFPTPRRRAWIAAAHRLYRTRGTLAGLQLAVEIATGGKLVREFHAATEWESPDHDLVRKFAGGREAEFPRGGGVTTGRVLVIEEFRLRRVFATILGADLSVSDDPLLPGLLFSSNSFVGDTLILGDEERKEFLALFRHAFSDDPGERQVEEAAVFELYNRLAHRVTILVQDTVSAADLGILRRVAEREAPAHVLVTVVQASRKLIIGLSSLVEVDTYLTAPPPGIARLDASHLGEGDFIQRLPALDPRLGRGEPEANP